MSASGSIDWRCGGTLCGEKSSIFWGVVEKEDRQSVEREERESGVDCLGGGDGHCLGLSEQQIT